MKTNTRSIIISVGVITAAAVLFTLAATAQSTRPVTKAAATNGGNNTVRITPIGARTGEYCNRDRALLFEDPTGVRILYDPGVNVTGGADDRLGEVHAILVSHSHYDHIGYRKLTQDPDDPEASCSSPQSTQTGNTTTAEIAAVKNSAVLVNTNMAAFLSRKIENIRGVPTPGCPGFTPTGRGPTEIVVPLSSSCTGGPEFGSLTILTRAASTPGVRINVVAALHHDGLFNTKLLFTDPLGGYMDDNLLKGYDGLAQGYVLTFTNGLAVYLTGDTGPTSDMALIVRDFYHPNLAVANVDGINSMGPEEAAYAMKQLVQPVGVIPSHAEEAVTINGRVNPDTRTAAFIELLGDTPAYVPLSGRTMEFDGNAQCVAGCGQKAGSGRD